MSITSSSSTTADVVDTYLAAYSEPDQRRRRELIEEVFARDALLADPPMAARGHGELDAMFGALQGQFPAHRFRRTTAIDEHHGVARYGWELISPEGTPSVAGIDVAEVDAEGRLAKVTGFFGDLVPRAD